MGLKVGYSSPDYPSILQILILTAAADIIRHAHFHRKNMIAAISGGKQRAW